MKRISKSQLNDILQKIDGRRYSAYKRLRSIVIDYVYAKAVFTRVQSDPHAPPSILEITIPAQVHKLPKYLFKSEHIVPFTDYIARVLYRSATRFSRKRGSGFSGYIGIPKPSPRILRRSCVDVEKNNIILRSYIGLPARGRRILGEQAKAMLLNDVPELIKTIVMLHKKLGEIESHIRNYLDQEYLREWLYKNNYLFFIGDNSILPRESSISDKPMRNAIPFKSPRELRVMVKLPSGRTITGMAVPKGLIMITGGGYHGKTTLLNSIQEGIYNHVKGDGRELVVSRKHTILVRAEDGRIISHVDISTFISKLPTHSVTYDFVSLDASGSTSMAASINEAIEAGAEILLIDEDTSATNLLYKDEVMNEIVKEEPIRPLCLQVKNMIEKTNVGVVIIASASSSFISIADEIILMENFLPIDITVKAKKQAEKRGILPQQLTYNPPRERVFHGIRGLRKVKSSGFKIITEYDNGLRFELDLTYYPRIVEKGQVKLITHIIKKLKSLKRPMSVRELIRHVNELIRKDGFSAFVKPVLPDLTVVDGFDVVWVLNRLFNSSFTQR